VVKRTIGFENYKDREFEEYQGEDPPANTWLTAECNRAKYLPEDDQLVFYCTVIDHPDYTGWTRGVYCDLDSDSNMFWKTQDMIISLLGKKQAVTVDWENDAAVAAFLKKAKKFKVKTEEYNDRIKIRSTRPLLESVTTGAKSGPAKAAPARPEAELPGDVDAGDEELEDYTEEELGELEISELEEILKGEFEVDLPAKPRRDPKGEKYTDALIDAILEAQDEDATNPDAEDGAADEGDDPEFADGFEEDPDPEPAKPARRSRAKAAAPAAEPEPAAAPAARTRRARR
jgi:hypothetical protein